MDSKFEFFPKNPIEALALLYVQHQNLSEKTPSEILEMYMAAEEEIKKKRQEIRKPNNLSW